jgi:threonine aldolase
LVEHLKARGVLVSGLIGLRWVTHLDVDAAGIDHAVAATREFMTAGAVTAATVATAVAASATN